MSPSNPTPPVSPRPDDDTSLGEVVDYVKAYAKQETLGPLKGAGRWLGFGAAGAVALGLGLLLVLLGVLRLVQTEFDSWATDGAWSWAAYLIVFAVAVVLLLVTVSRIRRAELFKDPT